MIKHEFCSNPALESRREEVCRVILLLFLPGQEGPCSVLCWVLLPAVEAQRLWGRALLLRARGAQCLKRARVCFRHRLNSSLLFFKIFLHLVVVPFELFPSPLREAAGLARRLLQRKESPWEVRVQLLGEQLWSLHAAGDFLPSNSAPRCVATSRISGRPHLAAVSWLAFRSRAGGLSIFGSVPAAMKRFPEGGFTLCVVSCPQPLCSPGYASENLLGQQVPEQGAISSCISDMVRSWLQHCGPCPAMGTSWGESETAAKDRLHVFP